MDYCYHCLELDITFTVNGVQMCSKCYHKKFYNKVTPWHEVPAQNAEKKYTVQDLKKHLEKNW